METVNQLFGLHTEKLLFYQMASRGLLTFFITILYIRVAGLRTIGAQNALNQLTMLILGAILGRGIVSAQQPFFESLLTVFGIVLLHRFTAWTTYKSKWVGSIVKGEPILIFQDGQLNEINLKKTLTTADDVKESLHLFLNEENFDKIKCAYLERSGEISIIKK